MDETYDPVVIEDRYRPLVQLLEPVNPGTAIHQRWREYFQSQGWPWEDGVVEAFPWRQWQSVAYGALRWTPEVFWRSTLTELVIAIDGYCEAKGIKKGTGPTKAQMDQLLAKYG
ncbi:MULTISPECIES: phage tail assembly chaperone [unclassified Brucella]|uniref:phage tail assembly chaperone n=1 Tax=unclassified Brucella TaxID=2632610 RepID=UPI0012ADA95A|nr:MULTISPECIES: phage tail assembly chaperone [unclassified Brucella]MRN44927.1 phage tail assembly chaperone [Brucella sp. 09RB8913]MRN58734.1 phage tail assembly chaperone [Brucella sp. 09RB8918]CAB4327673.1 hypothetical protein BCH_03098 [Brucella sp. 191011898]